MKKKKQKKQYEEVNQYQPTDAGPHNNVKDTAKLMLGGIIVAAAVCVVLIVVIVTQRKPPVILPVNMNSQQMTTDGGPDTYGRPAGDEHYGHNHP